MPTRYGVPVGAAPGCRPPWRSYPLLRLAVARLRRTAGVAGPDGCDGCGAPIGLDRPLPALGPAARCPAAGPGSAPPPRVVEAALLRAVAVLVLVGGAPAGGPALAWWLGWAMPLVLVDAGRAPAARPAHLAGRRRHLGCCSGWPR